MPMSFANQYASIFFPEYFTSTGSVDPWSTFMVGIASIFSLLILAPLVVIFWLSFSKARCSIPLLAIP